MSWHAQRGKTIVSREEAPVFHSAIHSVVEFIRIGDPSIQTHWPTLFRNMCQTQQAASLEFVVSAIYFESESPPELTAWNEATLAAILGEIKASLELEIEANNTNELRQFLVLATGHNLEFGEDRNSYSTWEWIIDSYIEQFLWDEDYENDHFLDAPPATSGKLSDLIGVSNDYMTAIPPDLKNDDDLEGCLNRVLKIASSRH